mmetsp:Transcript_21680/g.34892  ORF Transcript_21680/g.34892 Transcript_21680/m.34892 type:complete len:94 (-) Transcript_21680:229-510(-)
MAGGTTTIIDCEFWNGECQQDGYEGTIHLYANGGGTLTISGSKFVGGRYLNTGSVCWKNFLLLIFVWVGLKLLKLDFNSLKLVSFDSGIILHC